MDHKYKTLVNPVVDIDTNILTLKSDRKIGL